MRQARVYYKDEIAGTLTQQDDGSFTFIYDQQWVANTSKPAISLTLPKTTKAYYSTYLFPFFFNMLPEGTNKQFICHYHKLDTDDHFSLLLITAQEDTIGAVRVKQIES